MVEQEIYNFKLNYMAHYAFLLDNIVTEVIVGIDETELIEGLQPELWYGNFRNKVCKRTSYNTKGGIHYQSDNMTPSENQDKAFRKNYAGIGYSYDESRDAFIPPKPFNSWILDDFSCLWNPPIPYPEDNECYVWDENQLNWIGC